MNEKLRIAALVPMRHRSVRVPGKNYRSSAGKPLFYYILTTLQACSEIDEIVVDTDSPDVINGIENEFPDVKIIHRPEHLLG